MPISNDFLARHKAWVETARNPAWEPFSFIERTVRQIYESVVKPGDFVIDGGANRGMHTLPLAEIVGETGRVIAVEAVPALAESLALFVQDNVMSNVEVIGQALGATNRMTQFHVAQGCDPLSGIRRRPDLENQIVHIVDVPMIALDTIVADRGNPAVRFIKLDLEGGEYNALQGAATILHQDSAPLLILENGRQWSGDLYGFTGEQWFELVDEAGYVSYDIFGHPFNLSEWENPDLAWYSIHAKRQEDKDFLSSQLGRIVSDVYANMPPKDSKPWATKRFPYALVERG